MKSLFKVILYLFVVGLMVQSFYPTYAINVNMVEIVENSEEVKTKIVKKPILSQVPLFRFGWNVLDYQKLLIFNQRNESSNFMVILDILIPPPKA